MSRTALVVDAERGYPQPSTGSHTAVANDASCAPCKGQHDTLGESA